MTNEIVITICIAIVAIEIGYVLGLRQGWKDAKKIYGEDNPYVNEDN